MKLLSGLLALFLFAVLPLYAADLSDLTYTTTDGEVTITDCDEAATGELIIPDTIEGNPVTRIGNSAFSFCSSLTGITIPDGVTITGYFAFAYCTSLTSITIPDSVISIGDFAFEACTSLTSITIPVSVISIGHFAFNECISLTSITIGDGLTSIESGAFYRCTSLTSIILPVTVTSIGAGAFGHCTSLTSITIPDSITNIGGGAFTGCSALRRIEVGAGNVNYTDVNGVLFNTEMTLLHTYPAAKTGANYVIPDSVTNIGADAFQGCTSLMDITIPDSVSSIGNSAFSGCTSLTNIIIPDGVTSIGHDTFASCSSLTSIAIPDSVTSIGDQAFRDCTSLRSITIPDSVTSIGRKAFRECPAVVEIRPATQNQLAAQLAAVTAERDARFTEDQIRGLSADYTIGLNDAGNVQMKFNLFESADLNTFTPLTLNPESLSVVDGSICLEFAPEDRAAFFRFSVE